MIEVDKDQAKEAFLKYVKRMYGYRSYSRLKNYENNMVHTLYDFFEVPMDERQFEEYESDREKRAYFLEKR